MATSSAGKKKPAKQSATAAGKTPAAFAGPDDNLIPSNTNPSKFSPTSESKINVQSLDASDGLLKLFTDCVKDIYWAENQLVKALPKMAKSAASMELSDAILTHLDQTRMHVTRLEQVFELLDKEPQARKCDAMEGLTKEGEGVIEDTDEGTPARDIGIIMASQKVEHYEIAAYTGMINLANKLGLNDIASILSETLVEEEESDEILADIADNMGPGDEATGEAAGDEEEEDEDETGDEEEGED